VSLLAALAAVAEDQDSSAKLRPLAHFLGADDVLLFVHDPELEVFLPPPGLPQTLAGGGRWQEFLRQCHREDRASLPSPYTGQLTSVLSRKVDEKLVLAALGGEPDPRKWNELCSAAPLLLALFEAAYRSQMATAQARLAATSAQEAGILTQHLLQTRRKLEAALSQAGEQRRHSDEINQRLRLAQDMALMGVWEWNIQTGQVNVSHEVLQIHGLRPETFGGTTEEIVQTFHADDRTRVHDEVDAALAGSRLFDTELRLVHGNGTIKWVATRAKVDRDSAGKPVRMLGFTMDITQRKLSEEALRRSERLAAAGRLAATIAHEINNPLESVTNLLYLLAQDVSLSQSARNFVDLAQHEIGRVSQMARQTLAFYRDTSTAAEVDLAKLLGEVLDLYGSKLKQSRIEVITEYEVKAPILGLRGELKQLFANLVNNAIEAMPHGGRLSIVIRETGHGATVSVSDTGIGISADLLPRLFEPFFTTKQHTGTGLGLWVSKGIAEKHGGAIRVISPNEGEESGTTFSVYLSGSAFDLKGPTVVEGRPAPHS